MSKVQERIAQIRTQLVGESGARVLLVEGSDDVDAFRIFLDKKFPAWEQAWHLVEAGNKRMVQQIAAAEPQWLGLVDRDEWTEDEIQQRMQETTNLLVLPRFCMESYLIEPGELYSKAVAKAINEALEETSEERGDRPVREFIPRKV